MENLQSGRLEEGKRYPKSNLEPVAQSTLIGHLRLVFFVLKDLVSKKVFFFFVENVFAKIISGIL